jgi:hypothetical protein
MCLIAQQAHSNYANKKGVLISKSLHVAQHVRVVRTGILKKEKKAQHKPTFYFTYI